MNDIFHIKKFTTNWYVCFIKKYSFTYILQNWISNLKRPENRHSLEDFPELLQILHCNLLYEGSRGCRNHFTCTKLQILDLLWFKSIATHKILLLIAKLVSRFLSIIVHLCKCKTTNPMLQHLYDLYNKYIAVYVLL